jgi:hypothetical protein
MNSVAGLTNHTQHAEERGLFLGGVVEQFPQANLTLISHERVASKRI